MTGLFQDKSAGAMLQDIRKQFTDHTAKKDNHPLHWGQFLDNAAVEQAQVGLYGAVSACLAITANGRASDEVAKSARSDLVSYWGKRNSTQFPDSENNLRQNVRLAFLLLGLALGHKFTEAAAAEVWAELRNRRLSTDGLWSDALLQGDVQHPSEYSSAIILILLAVVRRCADGSDVDFGELDAVRADAGKKLQRAYLDDRKKTRQYKVVILVAIMLSLQRSADSKIKDELNKISLKSIDVRQRYTHFYDFKRLDNTQSRDYLILPVNLLGAYLLFGDGLPPRHYFYATRVLEATTASIGASPNHLFMEGERPSTLEQGIVVVALEAWIRNTNWKSGKFSWPKVWWYFSRDKDFTRLTAFLFLIALYGPAAFAVAESNLIEYLTSHASPAWLISAVHSLQLPKWVLAGLAVLAAGIAKPQDLVRVFLSGKK